MGQSASTEMDIDLLLLGKTGHGKSATGNSILGRERFCTSNVSESCTLTTDVGWTKRNGMTLQVVDGPGLTDTDLDEVNQLKKMEKHLSDGFLHCPNGFHAFVLVHKYDARFTVEDRKVLNLLKRMLGENFLKNNGIVVLTGGDKFSRSDPNDDLQSWVERQQGGLRQLMDESCRRVVLFDNVTAKKREASAEQLISMARRLGQRYTWKYFDQIAKMRSSRPPPMGTDDVKQLAQKLLQAVKSQRKFNEGDVGVYEDKENLNLPSGPLDAQLIVIKQKTETHYHYPKCDCNNKQTRCESVKVEKSETLDVSVGSTKSSLLHRPQGDDQEKEDEEEYMYRAKEERETGREERGGRTLDANIKDKPYTSIQAKAATESSCEAWDVINEAAPLDRSSRSMQLPPNASTAVSSPTTTTFSSGSATKCPSVSEIRRRLESQAGYMEKMVQSCVAGGGVCQDLRSDLAPFHHRDLHVPINLNFIMQPKNVEVFNTKHVSCEKAEIETAELMPVNRTCNLNYSSPPSSDGEEIVETTDDDDVSE